MQTPGWAGAGRRATCPEGNPAPRLPELAWAQTRAVGPPQGRLRSEAREVPAPNEEPPGPLLGQRGPGGATPTSTPKATILSTHSMENMDVNTMFRHLSISSYS